MQSPDCLDVINLAVGLEMNSTSPTEMDILKNDCCSSTHLVCTLIGGVKRVKEINWNSKEVTLTGFINGSALPQALTKLRLNQNEIVGHLPTTWPKGMMHIEVNKNYLYGDISQVIFPPTMQILQLGWPNEYGNHFSGTLNLYRPVSVKINHNLITGIQINDTSLLNNCDLSDNPLLGNFKINNLTQCRMNYLFPAIIPSTTVETVTAFITIATIQLVKSECADTIPGNTTSMTLDGKYSKEVYNTSQPENSPTLGSNLDPSASFWVLYALVGGFIGLCILTIVAKMIFKHPKLHSKFGRKNSFGTLNTVNTRA